ncbi:MAG: SUMF1/EgtB/PvdO family nonheme iron enzyme, partial [Verrucomicrobia bacterium]|nr:SUMF1/EgtB/PvdO family nonheme iron enzyme [Verrucomicrobiota bacterium]
MKNRNTVNWIRGITLGIAATALVLLTYDNNAQTESVVKGGRTVEIKTGENYTLPLSEKVSLDMIWIEPGTFMMGSPESESSKFAPNGYSGFKKPETQHRVTLTKGYWLGKYEVTQAQYEAIMRNNPSDQPGKGGQYIPTNQPREWWDRYYGL